MKKLFAILLSAILLAGCSGQSTTSNIAKTMTAAYKNLELNIYPRGSYSNGGVFSDADWEAYMQEKYGILIYMKTGGYNSDPNGLSLMDAASIYSLSLTTQILPIEGYLADNKVWNSLPEDFRKRFEINGHIWAIPKSTTNTLSVASIRTDWLKEAGQEMPQTAEQLYNAGIAIAKTGSDSVKRYMFGCDTGVIREVFNAYGLYLTADSSQVAYNPQKGAFEDALLQPQAKDALQMIRNIYLNGLMDPDSYFYPDQTITKSLKGSYGIVETSPGKAKFTTGFGTALENSTPDTTMKQYKTFSETYEPLSLYSKSNPKTYSDDGNGYVLLSNTKDPERVVNAFVDLLFGSLDSYLDCTLGKPKGYKVNSDASIVLTKRTTAFHGPSLADALDLFGSKYCVVGFNDDPALALQRHADELSSNKAYIQKYTADDSLIKIPPWYNQVSTYYGSSFDTVMKALRFNNQSIDSILALYKTTIEANETDFVAKYNKAYFNK